MKVSRVDPESPLFGRVRAGFSLLAVNGRPVLDYLDFRFRTADNRVSLRFSDRRGKPLDFSFREVFPGELGLEFEDDRVRRCRCNCIFCFVRQQPKGMRPALYVKDEDYRLSFTHGNFITLSNLTPADEGRIIEQRLSPLYVSVHTVDDDLRRTMLGSRRLGPVLPQLQRLIDGGITVHAQVVVCPGLNDSERLSETISELARLHPGVATLAVVPVGLTRFRQHLPRVRGVTPDDARATIDLIQMYQKRMLKSHGTRFVWPADEYYVLADRDFPSRSVYEELEQFENGVGMMREFVTQFNRRRAHLRHLRSRRRALFVTGESAEAAWRRHLLPFLRKELGLSVTLLPVPNRFWGRTVTVSGLLVGKDILSEVRKHRTGFDVVVLPPNCLNGDGLFLDDLSLSDFQRRLGKPVVAGSYDLAETVREVFA